MKFSWVATSWVDGNEIFEHVIGEEMLDVGDVPFDPPQYYEENISHDPQQFEQVPNDGTVTGLNRGAGEGEIEGNITPQHLIWGMDTNMYKVVAQTFTALDETERQTILDARQSIEDAQNQALAELEARVAELESAISGDSLNTLTKAQIDTIIDTVFDPTDFQGAVDFGEMKTAIGQLFGRQKDLITKLAYRINLLTEIYNK